MKSIFEIADEKYNIKKVILGIKKVFETEEVVDDRESRMLVFGTEFVTPLEKYIDKHNFRGWKYRADCMNVLSYKEMLGILALSEESDDEVFLRYLEYVYNMIKIFKTSAPFNKTTISAIETSINNVIARCNYELLKIDDEKYVFVNKNEALEVLNSDLPSNISLCFASYFAINNTILDKRKILKSIFDYLEGRRDEFDNSQSKFIRDLASDVFYYANNFNIRHNNDEGKYEKEGLKNISQEELENIYDNVVNNCILLLLSQNQYSFIEKTKEYKNEIK